MGEMKTVLFETIDLFLKNRGITLLKIKSHYGVQEITLSARELDILIALLVNHRQTVSDKLREERAERNLIEEQKKAGVYRGTTG